MNIGSAALIGIVWGLVANTLHIVQFKVIGGAVDTIIKAPPMITSVALQANPADVAFSIPAWFIGAVIGLAIAVSLWLGIKYSAGLVGLAQFSFRDFWASMGTVGKTGTFGVLVVMSLVIGLLTLAVVQPSTPSGLSIYGMQVSEEELTGILALDGEPVEVWYFETPIEVCYDDGTCELTYTPRPTSPVALSITGRMTTGPFLDPLLLIAFISAVSAIVYAMYVFVENPCAKKAGVAIVILVSIGILVSSIDFTEAKIPLAGYWADSCSTNEQCRARAATFCAKMNRIPAVIEYKNTLTGEVYKTSDMTRCVEGQCNYMCRSEQAGGTLKCNRNADCVNMKCNYGIKEEAKCVRGECTKTVCRSREEAEKAGEYGTCTKNLCEAECKERGSQFKSGYCNGPGGRGGNCVCARYSPKELNALQDPCGGSCTSNSDCAQRALVCCNSNTYAKAQCTRAIDARCPACGTVSYCTIECDMPEEVIKTIDRGILPAPTGETLYEYYTPAGTGMPDYWCGDGRCSDGETCKTCETDCGSCRVEIPESCPDGSTRQTYLTNCETPDGAPGTQEVRCRVRDSKASYEIGDCVPVTMTLCGDNVCSGSETKGTCPQDCAECFSDVDCPEGYLCDTFTCVITDESRPTAPPVIPRAPSPPPAPPVAPPEVCTEGMYRCISDVRGEVSQICSAGRWTDEAFCSVGCDVMTGRCKEEFPWLPVIAVLVVGGGIGGYFLLTKKGKVPAPRLRRRRLI